MISFVSQAWDGRATDGNITNKCGISALLRPGDMVVADKGFTVEDLLQKIGCTLNIPPFKRRDQQFSPDEIAKGEEIGELRKHVESEREKKVTFLME